ncbi:hypothetical protein BJX99DRAFT_253974 [Aspergillus californicus]
MSHTKENLYTREMCRNPKEEFGELVWLSGSGIPFDEYGLFKGPLDFADKGYAVTFTGIITPDLQHSRLRETVKKIKERARDCLNVDVGLRLFACPDPKDAARYFEQIGPEAQWQSPGVPLRAMILLEFSKRVDINSETLNLIFKDFPHGAKGWDCLVPGRCGNFVRLHWLKQTFEVGKGVFKYHPPPEWECSIIA